MLIKSSAIRNFMRFYSTQKTINSQTKTYPRRIFSGIQPTGSIHLGNYLGAISQWITLQNQNEDMLLCIVDLHAITLPHDARKLPDNILELTATLLASGIDPDKSILFQQSTVPAHAELSWCLGCLPTMARLAHLPQYKEKTANVKEIPLGIFIYPVLQAADILLYKTTHVPVGEDQIQQIQLAQEIARTFNNRFQDIFPIPHTLITSNNYSRIKSLRNPSSKMSKSDPDVKSRICLTDPADVIVRNIKKAVTDCTSRVTYDPIHRPGVSNLISIHSFVTNKNIQTICEESDGLDTAQYKMVVADAVVAYITPIRESIYRYLNDKLYLIEILNKGKEKASVIANRTLDEVHSALGFNLLSKNKRDKLDNLYKKETKLSL